MPSLRAGGAEDRRTATFRFSVEAGKVALDDPLARIEGAWNAVVAEIEPIGEIMIAGPGAGRELAGQGVYSDLIRIIANRRDAA